MAQRAPVTRGWISRYGLAYLGQNIAWAAPANLLLAQQILSWFPDSKEAKLSLLMTLGGLVGMIASPAAGILSDRTRSRWGRRVPWIVAGTVGAALALGLAALSSALPAGAGFPLLVVAWMMFQFVIALAITPMQSVAPDCVPSQQFGMVSGVMGMTYTLAVVLGTAVAAALPQIPAYLVTMAVLVLTALPFLLHGQTTAAAIPTPPSGTPGLVIPAPRQFPDYWWMFVTRLLLTLAQAIALFYLLYFLRDRIHYADPDTGVLILTGVFAICVVITAVWSGWFSDRVGVRKPFVWAAAVGVAGACALLSCVTSFALVIVGAVLLGLSWGSYQAIDQALVNHVLPSERERGTHMGLMNLAVAVPNTLAPVVAALAVTWLGGYLGLYLLAAVLAALGGALVTRIRGTR